MWGIGGGQFEQKYKTYHGKGDLFWYARAHCIPLRICAEGGFVTLTAFFILLVLVIIRLSYGFTRRARRKEPEWSRLTRTMAVIFFMIILSSLFTDIFYENSESIMFLSVLSVCGACGHKHTGRLLRQHFLFLKRRGNYYESVLNMFFDRIGWEYLGFIKIKSIIKLLVIIVLAYIIYLGVSNANSKRNELFSNGKNYYGFLNHYKKRWYIIDSHATAGFIAKSPAFSFSYKAFNAKMSQLDQYLELYINGVLNGRITLDSIYEKIIYCDISSFSGNKVKIDFKVNRTFIPLEEKWFIDSHEHGAVITKPAQQTGDLATIREKVKNDKRARWMTNPDFHSGIDN